MAPRKPKQPVTAAQLPPGTKIWGLAFNTPTTYKTTSETGGDLTTSFTPIDSTSSSTTSPDNGTPPSKHISGKDCDKHGLLRTLLKANYKGMNGRIHSMDRVSFPPPSSLGSKRPHDGNEIEHAIKRQMGSTGGKIDKSNNILDKMRVKPTVKKPVTIPPREIVPLKYTKNQRKADVAAATTILEKHFGTLRIIKKPNGRGSDKLSFDYFSLMRNRSFLDLLKRTNDIGKTKMIALATRKLISKLTAVEAEKGCRFDYRTFESQYLDALSNLQTGSFSVPYIKRNVQNAEKVIADTSSQTPAAPHGKPKDFPALADYRLVWPVMVFRMAWMHKDYKMVEGANCFRAAGFTLEAILNNILRRRRLPCSGHQEWYCSACPGIL